MEGDELDREDGRSTRPMRPNGARTERLQPQDTNYGEPIRQDWRRSRVGERPGAVPGARSSARARRAQTLPTSPDEVVVWLQGGGWKWALGIVGGLAVLVLIMIVISPPPRPIGQDDANQPAASNPFDSQIAPAQDAPTSPPEPTLAPPSDVGVEFRVTGTAEQGLFLRLEPNTNNPPITTLPEGTIVTIIGEDFVGPDRVWKNIRSPDGAEGWGASDFLQRAQ